MRPLLAALAALALAADPPAFGSREELRGQVREILMAHSCRTCHLAYLPTAVPKAVQVFDLTREDWPATMTDRQLRAMRGRLAGMSPAATAAELDTVDHFLRAETRARAGAGAGAGPTSSSPRASPPPAE